MTVLEDPFVWRLFLKCFFFLLHQVRTIKIKFFSIIIMFLEYSTQILAKGQTHRPKHHKVFSKAWGKGIFQNQEICSSLDN